MTEVGIGEFTVALNSRHVLAGLLEAYKISPELGTGVLTSLDKLDKLPPAAVTSELAERGLAPELAGELVEMISARDAADRIRAALKPSEEGLAGLDEVDAVLELCAAQLPAGRVVFTPSLVRGLSYYTGPIWEIRAPGGVGSLGGGGRYDHLIEALGGPDVPAVGSSIGVERVLSLLPGAAAEGAGRLDVAVTILGDDLAAQSFALAGAARAAGLRASVYLGSSGKISKQLRWASDQGARWCLLYGAREREAGLVKVRDMVSREEADVPPGEVPEYLSRAAGRL
jgi:histidyl-tRNA synthetase